MECPNCGAELQTHRFCIECVYCGYLNIPKRYRNFRSFDSCSYEIEQRFNYLEMNHTTLKSSPFVIYEKGFSGYQIISTPRYYANDGNFNKISGLSLSLKYENDSNHELLYLIVYTTEYIISPYFSILLNDRTIINPKFNSWHKNSTMFTLNYDELDKICESFDISISTNLFENKNAEYNEFIHYCCRFYNIVFNKCNYLYSIHKNLISDKK